MLEREEILLIRSYGTRLALGRYFLITSLILPVFWGIGMMINDLGFGGDGGSHPVNTCSVMLGLVAVCLAAFLWCVLSARIGMMKPRWNRIGVPDDGDGDWIDPEQESLPQEEPVPVAEHPIRKAGRFGILMPRLGLWKTLILLVPLLILTAALIPHFISSHEATEEKAARVSQNIALVQKTFTEDGAYRAVGIDQTYKGRDFFTFSCHDTRCEERSAYIYFTMDRTGAVTGISCHIYPDPALSPEENVADFNQHVKDMGDRLSRSGAAIAVPGVPEDLTVTPELAEKYYACGGREDCFASDPRRDIDRSFSFYRADDSYDRSYLYLSLDA